jgi:hypothetical protein
MGKIIQRGGTFGGFAGSGMNVELYNLTCAGNVLVNGTIKAYGVDFSAVPTMAAFSLTYDLATSKSMTAIGFVPSGVATLIQRF